jgi:hypothetical protein
MKHQDLYPVKLSFKIKKAMKIFLRQTNIEGICCQETYLARNVRGSLKKRKIFKSETWIYIKE